MRARIHRPALLVSLLAALWGCGSPPAEPETAPAIPLPTAVLAPGASIELATSVAFTEGPAAGPDNLLYFSEINGNRILRLLPDGSWDEFRRPSRRANGLAFDQQGRLIACEGAAEGGGRQVTRTNLDTGEMETLASEFEGKRLNSPNDLVVAQNGRIYFTDPRYGSQDGRELETEDVYLIDTDGALRRVATRPDIAKPNGIALSPDQKILYVADTQPGENGGPTEARVMAFDVAEDGSLSNPRSIYSFGAGRGIDGMAVDVEGNLYGAAGLTTNAPSNDAGVYVISPEGELIGLIPLPEDSVTNCAFGGSDLKTLYVTAGKQLFEIRTKNAGFVVFPPL